MKKIIQYPGSIKACCRAAFKSPFLLLMTIFSVFAIVVEAQTFIPASSAEVLYPDAPMSPPSYNLDIRNTKYLSNHSFPGTGPFTGSTLELAGWSTDNDGGFSYGISTFGTYSGQGAVALPNAKDVQVGYLFSGPKSYIVAAYYDVSISKYSYNLYEWNLMLGSTTFLYKYDFMRPEILLPMYVPHADYFPGYPGGGVTAPPINPTTMQYNRISTDCGKDGQKIVFVMTDQSDGKMFTTVGTIIPDTIMLCPYLPNMPQYPVATPGGTTPTTPLHIITTVSPYTGWTPVGGGAYDYFDRPSGIYARHYTTGALAGLYHYSYYPIDEWKFITEYDGTNCTQLPSKTNYSPLIGLKAESYVTTPGYNPHYEQYWPDVSIAQNWVPYWTYYTIDFVFYIHNNGIQDLYVGSADWTDLYNYTGPSSYGTWPTYFYNGPTDAGMGCRNTADGRNLTSDWTLLGGYGSYHRIASDESSSASLPSSDPVWANIDSKDGGYYDWAITFAYNPPATLFSTTLGYADPEDPTFFIHKPADVGYNNIYVRYQYKKQAIVNNGSIAHFSGGPAYAAINTDKNINPTLCWDATGQYLSVGWASERAGRVNMTPWAYIACKLDPYFVISTGPTVTAAKFTSLPDYLHVGNTPSQDCGFTPLISFSKQSAGLSSIYSAFTQEDAMATYSVVHKDNPWSSVSTWRKTDETVVTGNRGVGVSPNPFTSKLTVATTGFTQATLYDVTGRQMFTYSGEEAELNTQINKYTATLVPGVYSLMLKPLNLDKQFFKLVKQ